MKRIYNLKRQDVDIRDYHIRQLLEVHKKVKLPVTVDLRSFCPPVYDQGNLGSCTANAGVAARIMLNKLTVNLSRLYQYFCERKIERTISKDSGANMRDIGKAMLMYGICLESLWPYNISKFAMQPPPSAVTEASEYTIKSYYSVPDLPGIKQVLSLRSQPVMIGIDIYDSFESVTVEKTGIVPVPNTKKESYLGGHAILVVGYDDRKNWLICRNSWGASWGDKGYFYLPYAYVTKGFAYDFWVLQN